MKYTTARKIFFTSLIPDEYIDAAADGKLIVKNCIYDVSEGFVYELFIRMHFAKCKVSSYNLERRKVVLQRLLYAFSGVQYDKDKLWSRSLRMKKKLASAKLSAARYFGAGFAFTCELPLKKKKTAVAQPNVTLANLLTCQPPERIASALLRRHPQAITAAALANKRTQIYMKRYFRSTYRETAASVTAWMDKFCISKAAYAGLRKLRFVRMLLPGPKAIRLEKDRLEDLGPQSSLHAVDVLGSVHSFVSTDVSFKMCEVLQFFYCTGQLQKQLKVLSIKISGDGFLMRRKGWTFLHFTVVDVCHPHSADANWVISMAKCAEKSEVLRAMCAHAQLSLLQIRSSGIQLGANNDTFQVEFYISADQKFLAVILGLKGPTNACFCPWCVITKEKSQNGVTIGTLRTMDSLRHLSSAGQECLPMLTFVEMDRIIPDILHLAMRCVEKLVLVLFVDARKTSSDMNNSNSAQFRYVEELRLILQMEEFVFYIGKNPKNWKKPNFTGQQCQRILDNLDKLIVYRDNEAADARQLKKKTVDLHRKIFTTLNQNKSFSDSEIDDLAADITVWTKSWVGRFASSWINSCHVVSQHIIYYLHRYRNIYKFSQQGVEATVKTVKQNVSGGILGSADASWQYMCREGRRTASLQDRAKDYKVDKCEKCHKEGHTRKSSKSCDFYGQ
jgi:hypothetical protein